MDGIKPFKDIPITTMVVICDIDGIIELPEVFTLMPVTKLTLNSITKNKLPHHPVPGSILSMRYNECIRGIVMKKKSPSNANSKKGSHFKNAITVDMSIEDKNVNLRLTPRSIHMTGIKSMHQAESTVDHLVRHIKNIQENIDYMQSHPDQTAACVNHIKNSIMKNDEDCLFIKENDEYDPKIMQFLTTNMKEFQRCSDYLTDLEWVVTRTMAYSGALTRGRINKSMVNYNYELGFQVNRKALAESLRSYGDFTINYDNALSHSVKVTVPFVIPEGYNVRRKKRKGSQFFHTIMVYKSGRVTQSGPCEEFVEDVYYRFNTVIKQIQEDIKMRKPERMRILMDGSGGVSGGGDGSWSGCGSGSTADSSEPVYINL